MNWVGGARNRLKLKHERKIQKEFFERKRHCKMATRIENQTEKSLQGNGERNRLSQDLIALQALTGADNKPAKLRNVRHPRAVNLDNPKSTGNSCGTKRSYAVELPESPGPSDTLPAKLKKTHHAVLTPNKQQQSIELNNEILTNDLPTPPPTKSDFFLPPPQPHHTRKAPQGPAAPFKQLKDVSTKNVFESPLPDRKPFTISTWTGIPLPARKLPVSTNDDNGGCIENGQGKPSCSLSWKGRQLSDGQGKPSSSPSWNGRQLPESVLSTLTNDIDSAINNPPVKEFSSSTWANTPLSRLEAPILTNILDSDEHGSGGTFPLSSWTDIPTTETTSLQELDDNNELMSDKQNVRTPGETIFSKADSVTPIYALPPSFPKQNARKAMLTPVRNVPRGAIRNPTDGIKTSAVTTALPGRHGNAYAGEDVPEISGRNGFDLTTWTNMPLSGTLPHRRSTEKPVESLHLDGQVGKKSFKQDNFDFKKDEPTADMRPYFDNFNSMDSNTLAPKKSKDDSAGKQMLFNKCTPAGLDSFHIDAGITSPTKPISNIGTLDSRPLPLDTPLQTWTSQKEKKWKHFNIYPGHSAKKKLPFEKDPEVPMDLTISNTLDEDRISPKTIFLKNISQAPPLGCTAGKTTPNYTTNLNSKSGWNPFNISCPVKLEARDVINGNTEAAWRTFLRGSGDLENHKCFNEDKKTITLNCKDYEDNEDQRSLTCSTISDHEENLSKHEALQEVLDLDKDELDHSSELSSSWSTLTDEDLHTDNEDYPKTELSTSVSGEIHKAPDNKINAHLERRSHKIDAAKQELRNSNANLITKVPLFPETSTQKNTIENSRAYLPIDQNRQTSSFQSTERDITISPDWNKENVTAGRCRVRKCLFPTQNKEEAITKQGETLETERCTDYFSYPSHGKIKSVAADLEQFEQNTQNANESCQKNVESTQNKLTDITKRPIPSLLETNSLQVPGKTSPRPSFQQEKSKESLLSKNKHLGKEESTSPLTGSTKHLNTQMQVPSLDESTELKTLKAGSCSAYVEKGAQTSHNNQDFSKECAKQDQVIPNKNFEHCYLKSIKTGCDEKCFTENKQNSINKLGRDIAVQIYSCDCSNMTTKVQKSIQTDSTRLTDNQTQTSEKSTNTKDEAAIQNVSCGSELMRSDDTSMQDTIHIDKTKRMDIKYNADYASKSKYSARPNNQKRPLTQEFPIDEKSIIWYLSVLVKVLTQD